MAKEEITRERIAKGWETKRQGSWTKESLEDSRKRGTRLRQCIRVRTSKIDRSGTRLLHNLRLSASFVCLKIYFLQLLPAFPLSRFLTLHFLAFFLCWSPRALQMSVTLNFQEFSAS